LRTLPQDCRRFHHRCAGRVSDREGTREAGAARRANEDVSGVPGDDSASGTALPRVHGDGRVGRLLFDSWSTAALWKPERRYDVPGTDRKDDVRDILEAVDEVFRWIKKYW